MAGPCSRQFRAPLNCKRGVRRWSCKSTERALPLGNGASPWPAAAGMWHFPARARPESDAVRAGLVAAARGSRAEVMVPEWPDRWGRCRLRPAWRKQIESRANRPLPVGQVPLVPARCHGLCSTFDFRARRASVLVSNGAWAGGSVFDPRLWSITIGRRHASSRERGLSP